MFKLNNKINGLKAVDIIMSKCNSYNVTLNFSVLHSVLAPLLALSSTTCHIHMKALEGIGY